MSTPDDTLSTSERLDSLYDDGPAREWSRAHGCTPAEWLLRAGDRAPQRMPEGDPERVINAASGVL